MGDGNFDKTNFEFYIIDQSEQEKLIEIYNFFNKKDNAYPIDYDYIYLNDKNKKISNYNLFFNLIWQVFILMPRIDRFYRTTLELRMEKPIQSLYNNWIKYHKTIKEEIKENIIEDIEEKPAIIKKEKIKENKIIKKKK